MFELRQIGLNEKEPIKTLFQSVFMFEPWNDDWIDVFNLEIQI